MYQLSIVGISFVFMGIFLQLLPKLRYFKWCIEVKSVLICEAEMNGNAQEAKMLRNEVYTIAKKLPILVLRHFKWVDGMSCRS